MTRAAMAALLLALGACGGPWLPDATPADAARTNVALEDLQQGRKLLVAHCSGCHLTPSPRDHDRADWPTKVSDMRERAKVDTAQAALITQYLTAFASK